MQLSSKLLATVNLSSPRSRLTWVEHVSKKGRHPTRFKLTSVVNTLLVKNIVQAQKIGEMSLNILFIIYFLCCFELWGNGSSKNSMGFTVSLSTAIFVAHLISIAKANFVTSLPSRWSNYRKGTEQRAALQ